MTRFTDAAYLRDEQYKTPSNLAARADLHRRFSVMPGSWFAWVFDQIALQPGERVLEVGGGPGWLWRANQARLPAGAQVCFSDFTLGMLRAARASLGGVSGFGFANADAQHLPVAAGSFDLLLANQMLYHVPDLSQAVAEMARALRTGGRLCAATNGAGHMAEYYALVHAYDSRYPEPARAAEMLKYRLENAADWLAPAFTRVEVRRRPDTLWVTDADALVDYALSTSAAVQLAGSHWASGLRAFFQTQVDKGGGIRITKDMGVVLAFAN